MIKKLLNFVLSLFLPYFLYSLLFMLILGFIVPLSGAIPSLINPNYFLSLYDSNTIFIYLNKLYKLSLCIFIIIYGYLIHLYVKKSIISSQRMNISLLPFERKTMFFVSFTSLSIWGFILLIAHVIITFMGLSIFAILNLNYQNLYSLFLIEHIDLSYILFLLSYFFIEEMIILLSLFSSFLSFTYRFKKFNYLFFFIFYITILLCVFGLASLIILPIKDINLKYVVILLLSTSICVLFTYLNIYLYDKKIETN